MYDYKASPARTVTPLERGMKNTFVECFWSGAAATVASPARRSASGQARSGVRSGGGSDRPSCVAASRRNLGHGSVEITTGGSGATI